MIKPSQLKSWDNIDQSKASTDNTAGHPEYYGWFQHESGIFYPHRLPTINEIINDEFN